MPSDAHELAARLRRWDATSRITPDFRIAISCAAAELERLADENARMLADNARLGELVESVASDLHLLRGMVKGHALNCPTSDALKIVADDLSSAGPPQEVDDEEMAERLSGYYDPPPERRCTWPHRVECHDPACPVHGE